MQRKKGPREAQPFKYLVNVYAEVLATLCKIVNVMRTFDFSKRRIRETVTATGYERPTLVLQVNHVDALERRFTDPW